MIVSADCPYCGTNKVAFNVRFEFQVTSTQHEKYVLGTCGACRAGVIFKLHMRHHSANSVLVDAIGDQNALGMNIIGQWPSSLERAAPADVPPTVLRYFDQAIANIRSQNFDAAGVMFRKALEVATREKAPNPSDKSLIKRIDALATAGLITTDMKMWAHQIRLGGNEAAHDDEPFEEVDAERLRKFSEAFLTYAYTLPALVAEGQKEAE